MDRLVEIRHSKGIWRGREIEIKYRGARVIPFTDYWIYYYLLVNGEELIVDKDFNMNIL